MGKDATLLGGGPRPSILLGPPHAHRRRLGYLILQRYRHYAEEGLTGTKVAVWVAEDSLTVEYGGEALCRYEVVCDPATGAGSVGRLRSLKNPTLFEAAIMPQLRLFDLEEMLARGPRLDVGADAVCIGTSGRHAAHTLQ